jgi:hypothetical protein
LVAREDSLFVLLSATAEVVDDFVDEMTILRGQVLQLRSAMDTRAPIEQATGMVMMRYGLSAESAFRLLVRLSKIERVELPVLAVALVNLGIDEGRVTHHQQTPATPLGFGRAFDASNLVSSDQIDV